MFSSQAKSVLFGERSTAWPGYGGGPIVELSVCCKRNGLDPGSGRDPRFWGEGRAVLSVLLISEQREAGGRATQVVSVPASSSATTSPPSIM